MKNVKNLCVLLMAGFLWSCGEAAEVPNYDLIIGGGTIYDGSGDAPYVGDVAINGERIVAMGDLGTATALNYVDATGMAVSPGFINMLSWATSSLIEDPRGMSDIKQGVTLEVFGEGWSEGPYTRDMIDERQMRQGDIKYDITWNSLGGYLEMLETSGISPNVASFVGATTLRIHEVGYEDRAATPDELARMQDLVRKAMREGALGVGSSLIYAPANYASTDELTALVQAAGEYGGMYISHMRSEGAGVLEAIEELITIARDSGAAAEIYHLKASGIPNWDKLDDMFQLIESARAEGLRITANMYTYPASSTGLNASMPLWVQEGGHEAWMARLADPDVQARLIAEMNDPVNATRNQWLTVGPDRTLLVNFKTEELRYLIGKTVSEAAQLRGLGESPEQAAINMILEDDSRVGVVYFSMSPENIARKASQPWVSFGSDAGAPATEGVFIRSGTHPRAYGTFVRVLGLFVREQHLFSLAEAIRKLTSQPATNIGVRDRGYLRTGYYADVVVFDPATVTDHATFAAPHQYATGVSHVFVNGGQVLKDGEHTGATPGQVVRGPGWSGWNAAEQ
jgi:N-acyl-D-aspartate/D-glutamate deacylase